MENNPYHHAKRIKAGKQFVEKDWVYEDVAVPQQNNGVDCGVHVLDCFFSIVDNVEPRGTPDHIAHLRELIAFSLLQGKFHVGMNVLECDYQQAALSSRDIVVEENPDAVEVQLRAVAIFINLVDED